MPSCREHVIRYQIQKLKRTGNGDDVQVLSTRVVSAVDDGTDGEGEGDAELGSGGSSAARHCSESLHVRRMSNMMDSSKHITTTFIAHGNIQHRHKRSIKRSATRFAKIQRTASQIESYQPLNHSD